MAEVAWRVGRTGQIDNGGKCAAVARGGLKMNGRAAPSYICVTPIGMRLAPARSLFEKRRAAEAARRVIPPPMLQTTTTVRPNAGPLSAPVPHPPHFAPTA